MHKKETEDSVAHRIQQAQLEAADHKQMVSYRFFFHYLYRKVTSAPFYTHWKSILSYIRRFRAVTYTIRALSFVLGILETGALVLLSTALFLVILPILFALMLGILITARIESGRTNHTLATISQSGRVYVLFLPAHAGDFFTENAKNLARQGDTVLIVSPYWISPNGLSKGAFYCTARREADRIYLIRRYYFFSLQKHVLKKRNTVYIY